MFFQSENGKFFSVETWRRSLVYKSYSVNGVLLSEKKNNNLKVQIISVQVMECCVKRRAYLTKIILLDEQELLQDIHVCIYV